MMRYRVERLTSRGWQEVFWADAYWIASDRTTELIDAGERGVRIIDTARHVETEDNVLVCFMAVNPRKPFR